MAGSMYDRIIRIDCNAGKSRIWNITEDLKPWIGGMGYGTKILSDEVSPAIDALSPDNKIILTVRPLTGTPAPLHAQSCVVTKSPLTNTILNSYAGGFIGGEIKYCDIDGVIFEGRSADWKIVLIDDDSVSFESAESVMGMGTEETETWIKEKWPRMKYKEAIETLKPKFPKLKWGDDLGTKEERYLVDEITKLPVFVTHYPREMKAFYMKVDESNPKVVLNNDLMMPHVGETVGASEREWKLELLLENMKIHNLNPKDYAWYVDLRKYGSIPHSGFGLGIERALMSILNLEHIRDTLPYPRFMNRTYP